MIDETRKSTAALILVLAIAYFLTGKLGLLLAIPPGYATAIWPASGVAVAALLLLGNRLWPGVLLGSFLVNISIGYEPDHSLPDVYTLATAAAIGVGAALQALLARYLLHRFLGLSLALLRGGDIVLFFVLAGPLACIANATWGSAVLAGLGHISAADFAITWWTWWVGDTIGVLIVTPVVMSWLAEPRDLWQTRRRSVSLPMLIALLAVIAVFFYASAVERQRLQAQFERNVGSISDAFQRNLERHLEILYAVRSFFDSSNEVTRTEFRSFVSHHLARNPGIHALSWNPVVMAQAREELESVVRREGIDGFHITERNSNGELVAAAARDRHVVVLYIEPQDVSTNALGYDVASNPDRRVALDLAQETGRPVATAPITLVQETDQQAGILVFLPVYDAIQRHAGPAQSQHVLRGYVTGVFRIGDMLRAAFEPMDLGKYDIRLEDHSANDTDQLLQRYTTGVGPVFDQAPIHPPTALRQVFRFNELGRDWRLHITEQVEHVTGRLSRGAWVVSVGGLLFVSMLGAFLLAMTGRAAELVLVNKQLQDEVRERKRAEADIRDREARLSSIYASANEAIFVVDPERDEIIEVNPKALEMLEYTADEIVQTSMSVIHPRETDKLQAFAANVTKQGAAVTDALTCTTKSGRVFPAEISASRLIIDGRPLMLAMVRDISERRRNQALLQEANDTLEARVRERTAELIAAKGELEGHRDRLEDQVRERTQELEAANDELRSFSYIVSHDMRAPLLNIKGFTTELRSSIGELQASLSPSILTSLDGEKRTALHELLQEDFPTACGFIERSADKLDGQINAILKLSRLGYREFKPETIAFEPLVDEILKNLAHRLEKTKTSITIGALPDIVADRFAVEQILGNLLDNAVKYLEKDRLGEISVIAEEDPQEITVHVRDNGRGIAESDQVKIFRIFQRVGLQDQPGDGMGLAYVYSLVRRIGGRIRCESAPGRGSRFSVAFPKLTVHNSRSASDFIIATNHDNA